MNSYIAQKVQHALVELLTDLTLSQRLLMAQSHVSFINSDHFLSSAPQEVATDASSFCACNVQKDTENAARLLRSFIENTFEAFGKDEAQKEEATD